MKLANLTVFSVCAIAGMTMWLILVQGRSWPDQASSGVQTPSGVNVTPELAPPPDHLVENNIEDVTNDAAFALYELLPELERIAGPILEPVDLNNAPPELLQQEAEQLIQQADKLISDLDEG